MSDGYDDWLIKQASDYWREHDDDEMTDEERADLAHQYADLENDDLRLEESR